MITARDANCFFIAPCALDDTYYKMARDSNAKVVLLIFRISDEAARVRILAAGRSNDILTPVRHKPN